ncbi:hypothetical protein TrCOL_g8676 [Triparma columacea]|uniref:Uncharacterized protein n=1 Tax=Triparma columacea TaxID=722753 RepID=A0A9W7L1W0_9STRA|nr:hypothetical protein TrCOL_g8676 [Triparma columacea]
MDPPTDILPPNHPITCSLLESENEPQQSPTSPTNSSPSPVLHPAPTPSSSKYPTVQVTSQDTSNFLHNLHSHPPGPADAASKVSEVLRCWINNSTTDPACKRPRDKTWKAFKGWRELWLSFKKIDMRRMEFSLVAAAAASASREDGGDEVTPSVLSPPPVSVPPVDSEAFKSTAAILSRTVAGGLDREKDRRFEQRLEELKGKVGGAEENGRMEGGRGKTRTPTTAELEKDLRDGMRNQDQGRRLLFGGGEGLSLMGMGGEGGGGGGLAIGRMGAGVKIVEKTTPLSPMGKSSRKLARWMNAVVIEDLEARGNSRGR